MYTNLPVNAIVRLPHPQSGDSQDQETFLAPFADKQTRNYGIECSNHHPSLSILRPKGLNRSKMKWCLYIYIYIYIYIYYIYIYIYIFVYIMLCYNILQNKQAWKISKCFKGTSFLIFEILLNSYSFFKE